MFDPLGLRSRRLRAIATTLFLFASLDSVLYLNVVAGVGKSPPPPPSFWFAAYITGISSLVLWGACAAFIARSKGRSPLWGFAGALLCCGVAVVACLPARREEPLAEGFKGDYPRLRQKD